MKCLFFSYLSLLLAITCFSQIKYNIQPDISGLGVVADSHEVVQVARYGQTFDNGRITHSSYGNGYHVFDLYGNTVYDTLYLPYNTEGDEVLADTVFSSGLRFTKYGGMYYEAGVLQIFDTSNNQQSSEFPLVIAASERLYSKKSYTHVEVGDDIVNQLRGNRLGLDEVWWLAPNKMLIRGYSNGIGFGGSYFATIDTLGNVINEKLFTNLQDDEFFRYYPLNTMVSKSSELLQIFFDYRTSFEIDINTLEIIEKNEESFSGFIDEVEYIDHPRYSSMMVVQWDGINPVTEEKEVEVEGFSDVFMFFFDKDLNAADTVQIRIEEAQVMLMAADNSSYVDSNAIYLGIGHSFKDWSFHAPWFDHSMDLDVIKTNTNGDIIWRTKVFGYLEENQNGNVEKVSNSFWKVIGLEDGGVVCIASRYYFERFPLEKEYYFIRLDNEGEIVSVNNLGKSLEAKLYPNPVGNELFIELKQQLDFQYRIFSINGREMSRGQSSSGKGIQVSNLPKGKYVIQILDKNNQLYSNSFMK